MFLQDRLLVPLQPFPRPPEAALRTVPVPLGDAGALRGHAVYVIGLVAAVAQRDLLVVLVLEAASADAGGAVPAVQLLLLLKRDLACSEAPDVVEFVRAVRVTTHYELLVVVLARAAVLAQL